LIKSGTHHYSTLCNALTKNQCTKGTQQLAIVQLHIFPWSYVCVLKIIVKVTVAIYSCDFLAWLHYKCMIRVCYASILKEVLWWADQNTLIKQSSNIMIICFSKAVTKLRTNRIVTESRYSNRTDWDYLSYIIAHSTIYSNKAVRLI